MARTQPTKAFRLSELEPALVRIGDESGSMREVASLDVAQGIRFLCPLCFEHNGGAVRTHGVIAWFRDRGVPDDESPGPGRWTVTGSSIEDLTLSPSIHLSGGGCGWHGFVRVGEAK